MIAWRIWITLTSIMWVCICWASVVEAQVRYTSEIEVIDARDWDFSNRMSLSGNWTVIENKIVAPHSIKEVEGRTIFFPSLWNDSRPGASGTGCATYALNLLVSDKVDTWAFEIPQLYSSYNLWVNGNFISAAGVVGTAKDKVVPQWVYHIATCRGETDTLKIVLQIANYHHSKGGAKNTIYIGLPDSVKSHFNWSIGSNVVEAGVLFLEGLFFLIFYRKNKKPVILYFALLCLTWSIRAIFSNLYPVILVFPGMDWELLVKTEYITLYLAIIWAALFFNSLFEDISSKVFTYLPVAVNLFFIGFTILTPALIYSRWVSFYLGIAALVILYGVTLIVKALIGDKDGSWFLMGSIWTGVLLFGYDIGAYHGSFSYNIVFLNIGYLLIFLLTTMGLLYHIGVLKNKDTEKNVLTMKDL